jgi:hypothetical protein
LAITVLATAPSLAEQWNRSSQLRGMLAGKTIAERASRLDNPAFDVAHEIAAVVPATACVGVLAYAGPDAIVYYDSRLDYLLYPRRVRLAASSGALFERCKFLAVFRDTPANLATSPFSGQWDDAALSVRLAGLELLHRGDQVEVYTLP